MPYNEEERRQRRKEACKRAYAKNAEVYRAKQKQYRDSLLPEQKLVRQQKLKKFQQKRLAENGDHVRAIQKQAKKRMRDRTKKFIDECKKNGCTKCPTKHLAALDFHHRDPKQKQFEIAIALRNGMALERVKNEVSKCDVMCKNCHAILHWEERQN